MRVDAAGWPFIGGALILALGLGAAAGWLGALPFLVLAFFFLFFFRDPNRAVSARDNEVVSPADGRVLVAGPAQPGAPAGEWQQVSVFLSPMDVHVNRIPVSGRVVRVDYKAGRFLPAYRDDAGAANERSEIWIDHRGQMVVARQIVGVLARRVVCRVRAGVDVDAGERYGIMKFGSRMDIFLPVDAEVRVNVGDIVRGGQTVIAVLHSA
jgi:phosphatidylserine decarboxylase